MLKFETELAKINTYMNQNISISNWHINKIKNGALDDHNCNTLVILCEILLKNKRMIVSENYKLNYGEKDNFTFMYSFPKLDGTSKSAEEI